jgi:cytochrome c oxidase cbb3-type subunit III
MKIVFPVLLLMCPVYLQAQTASNSSYFSNALFNTLLGVIIVLTIIIIALSGVLRNISSTKLIEDKFRKIKDSAKAKKMPRSGLFVLAALLSFQMSAQGAAVTNSGEIGGISPQVFYIMMSVIAIELIVAGILMYLIREFLSDVDDQKKSIVTEQKSVKDSLYARLTKVVEIENEESILLDHNYDGIRELDNDLPPWWKYGFYLTILVAVIYLINYHVTKTSPLQAEEYALSVKKAEAEIAEYMKNSANNVDETTVKMLSDASDLSAGKDLYINNCAACHGKLGEGTVGPNLTDDYWLHSGGVSDIFKTIKYGWPDKGMKSWKDDFSPIQIAQITSFIRTLKGSNPPNAKEKQGDIYVEEIIKNDSTTVKDTVKTVAGKLPR